MSSYQSNQIKLINTSLIDPHPDNPRKNIGDVTDLAASIKTNGLLTPLSVVPNGERYRVIAGHRRLAACKQAGIVAVPCFVLQLGPLQQLEAMVTENCQREQLTVLEEADAIQGMLDLGATTASVAHRLGRSADYVRDRVKAASIKTEVRASRDDFGQISIGQLVAIARYDGQPDRQKELAQAAGTSNFDYILRRIERDDRARQWVESVAALLVEPDSGINLIPDPEKPYSDPEWRYLGCMFPSTGTPEELIEKIRELNPAAVSIHMEQVYLWTRRDKTADAEKEARRAAEQAERDARRRRNQSPRPAHRRHHRSRLRRKRRRRGEQPMTREQLERLAQLLTDTAQTASTIELRALAGGRAEDGIVAMAAGLRANCTACLVLVDGLMQEGVRCE